MLAGFSIITAQASIVFGVLLLILLSQFLINRSLLLFFGDQLSATDYFTLGLSGWILPASLISLIWLAFGFGFALAFLILAIILLFFIHLKPHPQPDSKIISLILLFA